ncbi:ABC transporter substrate-binding protein [Desertihabitans brevis]|uniref:ABC transporter substrate-binding protein n=1 Tax=Desertihabitans brevis TaxID=2268447 RepID=A0A367YZG6_9ACTN|nr:ABC transporter substrate-binding protein [Desertihabitans brevis]RCK70341.1 ABC transporter substrate-binding protein [Desertihabitans brevis]
MRPVTRALTPLAAGLLLLSAAACSTEEAGSAPGSVTITFSSYNYGTQGAAGTGTQALLDRFAELHPEITVEPQAVPVADVLTSARAATAAGEPPDVVQLGYSKLTEGLETLPVQPLDELAGADWEPHVAGILPGPVQTGTRDGHTYALPYTISIPTVLYNADLFERAGLDPDAPPQTMAEIRQAAEAVTATGAEGVYFGVADTAKSDYLTQSVMNSAGGGVLAGDGTVTADSPASVEGLRQVAALTADGLQPAVSVEDALAAFSTGDLGMLVISTAVLGTVQQAAQGSFELRTTGFPAFGDAPPAPTHSGASLVVLSGTEAEQQASWELVRFLTGEEGYRMIATEIGYLPLRSSVVAELGPWLEENPLLVPTIEQLDRMQPYRSFAGSRANQATQLLQDEAVAPIVLRGADPQSTLTATSDRIRELVGTP